MIFPFSIQAETIENGGEVDVTPTNGSMFSCRSHFQPTTSFAKRWECDVNRGYAVLLRRKPND